MNAELKANRVIAKDSKIGKAFAKTIDSTSRQDYPMGNFEAVQKAVLAVVGDSVPVLYAGKDNDPKALQETGADSFAVGMVQQQRKDSKGDTASVYRALAFWPLFSVNQLIEAGEEAIAWVEKLIDKETSHVTFRPLRNVDDSLDLTQHTGEMPTTITDLIASHASATRINNEMLTDLWPVVWDIINGRNPKAARFLPSRKAIAQVSKALRSADWARRNTPEAEEKDFWNLLIAPLLFKVGASDKVVDEEGEPIEHDMSVLEGWLEKRPTEMIEAVTQNVEKDPSALDDFLGSFDVDSVEVGADDAGESEGESDAEESEAETK